jgi:hypothetical protein
VSRARVDRVGCGAGHQADPLSTGQEAISRGRGSRVRASRRAPRRVRIVIAEGMQRVQFPRCTAQNRRSWQSATLLRDVPADIDHSRPRVEVFLGLVSGRLRRDPLARLQSALTETRICTRMQPSSCTGPRSAVSRVGLAWHRG